MLLTTGEQPSAGERVQHLRAIPIPSVYTQISAFLCIAQPPGVQFIIHHVTIPFARIVKQTYMC